jgi:soluble lytic murein transglycosylase-like protein
MKRAGAMAALALAGGALLLYSRRALPAEGGFSDAAEDIMNAVTGWTPPSSAAPYQAAIAAAEEANGLPHNVLARLIYQESRFRDDIISGATVSPAGAQGIAQFMPATAAELGVDPLDPFASIAAAGRYLRWLYNQTGDWRQALAAYNWGIGNVKRRGLRLAPLETRRYVAGIAGDIGLA